MERNSKSCFFGSQSLHRGETGDIFFANSSVNLFCAKHQIVAFIKMINQPFD